MTVPPTYDATKHHIGLKQVVAGVSGTRYGFMIAGQYVKSMQREALGAPDLGGSTDLIGQAPSLSRWTQDDFVGGMFAYDWGRDDAMFADSTGFMSSTQARSVISVPPFILKKAFDPAAQTDPPASPIYPKNMFMVGGSIYVVFAHGILRHQIVADTNTWSGSGATWFVSTDSIISAEYDATLQRIVVFKNIAVSTTTTQITILKTDLTLDSTYNFDGPTLLVGSGYGFTMFDQNFVVQVGDKLYSGVTPDNFQAVAAVITWTKQGRLPGRWKDSCAFNGMTYILLNDGANSPGFRASLVAYDGNAILPICVFPHSFYAKTVTEYAGRLFVGGTGTDVNGGEHYAELYEVTGASVRLVHTFSPETRNQFLSSGDWPNAIEDTAVFEGLLWYGNKGKRMEAYDVTSDGFFGTAELQGNTDLNPMRLVTGRGRLWAWVDDYNTSNVRGIYRIAQPADSPSAWHPTLVTSDFSYEPAMKKRWSEIVVKSKYDGCSSIEYSVNGGDNWTALTVVVSSTYGKLYYSRASLQAIDPTEHIRFRIKLGIGASNDAVIYHRELNAYTVSFAMLDNGKHGWSLNINGAAEIETRDAELDEGVTQVYNVSDVATTLWTWADAKTNLVFTDVDGTDHNVTITDIKEIQPLIGPNVNGRPEAQYAIQLLEV